MHSLPLSPHTSLSPTARELFPLGVPASTSEATAAGALQHLSAPLQLTGWIALLMQKGFSSHLIPLFSSAAVLAVNPLMLSAFGASYLLDGGVDLLGFVQQMRFDRSFPFPVFRLLNTLSAVQDPEKLHSLASSLSYRFPPQLEEKLKQALDKGSLLSDLPEIVESFAKEHILSLFPASPKEGNFPVQDMEKRIGKAAAKAGRDLTSQIEGGEIDSASLLNYVETLSVQSKKKKLIHLLGFATFLFSIASLAAFSLIALSISLPLSLPYILSALGVFFMVMQMAASGGLLESHKWTFQPKNMIPPAIRNFFSSFPDTSEEKKAIPLHKRRIVKVVATSLAFGAFLTGGAALSIFLPTSTLFFTLVSSGVLLSFAQNGYLVALLAKKSWKILSASFPKEEELRAQLFPPSLPPFFAPLHR